MARPKKKQGEVLSRMVNFRISEPDYIAYLKKVDESGLTASEFFRDAVLTNKTQIKARRKTSPDVKRMLYLMNMSSNNVNQLARRANADHLAGVLDSDAYERILYGLETIANLMKAFVRNADPD